MALNSYSDFAMSETICINFRMKAFFVTSYSTLFTFLNLFIQATVVPHQIQVELVKRMSCEESAVFFANLAYIPLKPNYFKKQCSSSSLLLT
jgi:hypothetical protein